MVSALFVLTACGSAEHSMLDKAQSSMDRRDYRKAIEILEEANSDHSSTPIKEKLAYAYLGAAGIEFADLARNVEKLNHFDFKRFSASSLPIIHLDHFPSPENSDLVRAFKIFEQVHPDAAQTPQEINLLLAALKFSLAIEYYNRLAVLHGEADLRRATLTIVNVKRSLESVLDGMHRLNFSYGKIKRFLHAAEKKPLIRVGSFSYYLSDKITMTNFFDFLTHSSEVTVQGEINNRTKDSRPVEQFLNDLSPNLKWLRSQTQLNDALIDAASLDLIHIASRIAPKSINLKPVFSPPNESPVQVSTKDLPRFAQRIVVAVNEAWRVEDAKVLFEEREHLLGELATLHLLANEWVTVPETFIHSIPEELVRQSEERLRIGLNSDPIAYYGALTETLNLWLKNTEVNSAQQILTHEARTLMACTETWFRKNLLNDTQP